MYADQAFLFQFPQRSLTLATRPSRQLKKNAPLTSKRNWIIEQPPQTAKYFLPAAPNLGAKIQSPNGYISARKGIVVARYGQGFPQAAQLNSSQKVSWPGSTQHASLNESRHGLTPETTSMSKSSPFTKKVPKTSQTGISFDNLLETSATRWPLCLLARAWSALHVHDRAARDSAESETENNTILQKSAVYYFLFNVGHIICVPLVLKSNQP